MSSSVKYPTDHDIDVDAELADTRYERALRRLTVSDVIATVDRCRRFCEDHCRRDHPTGARPHGVGRAAVAARLQIPIPLPIAREPLQKPRGESWPRGPTPTPQTSSS
jgi:hypothetical protein